MALKDKLMTLEDFKAVRDVDVASNNEQFTEIKADLGAIQDIMGSENPTHYELANSDFVAGKGFVFYATATYPYINDQAARKTYTKYDLRISPKKTYRIKATVTQKYAETAQMMAILYDRDLLNAYNAQTSQFNTNAHTAGNGWTSLTHDLFAKDTPSGESIGLILSFRQSSSNPTISNDFEIIKVEIEEINTGGISKVIGISHGTALYNLTNADLSRKARFIYGENTAYPYTRFSNLFITYTNFDLHVETGKYYRIKADVPSQYAETAGMIVIPYTQTLLDAYNNQASADTLHNTRAYAGWRGLDQIITVEPASTGESCIGILLSFRQASNAPAIDDAFVINSISVEEVNGAGEGDVVRYDISQNKTDEEKKRARDNINAAEKLYVTPQMFGAKGDGVSDDTAAFQSAINTGKTVYVPLRDGQVYVITDTLVVSNFEQVIYGDVINPNWGFGVHIRFNASNSVLFDFKSGMNGCVNLSVYTEGSGNVAIRFKKDTDTTNIDGSVINCSFRNFDISIDCYGRGLAAKRNVFFNARIAIRLTLTNDPRWDHDNPTLDELIQTYPEYNGRSLYVVDNRFHVTFERYLLVLSEDYTDGSTTIKQVLNGAIISGNMADIGRGGFEFRAPIKGCVFSGNEFLMLSQDTFFDCQAGAYDCSIVNNTIRGLIDTNYPRLSLYGKDCFVFNGLNYSSISGNVVENFKQRCVYIYGTGMLNSAVIGNVFKNFGIDTTVNQYERAGFDVSDCENSVVSNNTFMTIADFNGYIIRARDVNTNVWKRNVFNENTCTKRSSTEVLVPTTAGTEDNIIQGVS